MMSYCSFYWSSREGSKCYQSCFIRIWYGLSSFALTNCCCAISTLCKKSGLAALATTTATTAKTPVLLNFWRFFRKVFLEAYSRRENIKFLNIPEAREEDTEEVLRSFMERDLGYRNGRSVEIQRVHRLSNRRNSNTAPRPIIARFLRYKDVEEIFSLGRRLEGTDFQMFRDLPLEIIKRRKDQMTVFKQARRQGMRASFSKSQPDKLFINGSFWPPGKCLDATEAAE